MKWRNRWSASAIFESEFSKVAASYAGKGVVRGDLAFWPRLPKVGGVPGRQLSEVQRTWREPIREGSPRPRADIPGQSGKAAATERQSSTIPAGSAASDLVVVRRSEPGVRWGCARLRSYRRPETCFRARTLGNLRSTTFSIESNRRGATEGLMSAERALGARRIEIGQEEQRSKCRPGVLVRMHRTLVGGAGREIAEPAEVADAVGVGTERLH
jgi:hypothetical protein